MTTVQSLWDQNSLVIAQSSSSASSLHLSSSFKQENCQKNNDSSILMRTFWLSNGAWQRFSFFQGSGCSHSSLAISKAVFIFFLFFTSEDAIHFETDWDPFSDRDFFLKKTFTFTKTTWFCLFQQYFVYHAATSRV